jgi:hypothetical protein
MVESHQRVSLTNQIGSFLVPIFPLATLANVLTIVKIGNLSIRPSDLLFLLIMVVSILRVTEIMIINKRLALYLFLLLSYIFTNFTGLAINQSYDVEWAKYFRFVETMMWGGFAVFFIQTEKHLNRTLNNVVLMGAFMSLVSVGKFIGNPTLHRIAGYVSYAGGEGLQTQASYNEWGALYALIIGILIWRLYNNGLSFKNILLLGIVSAGFLLVQSRSASLAVLCTLCLLFLSDIRYILFFKLRKKSLSLFICLMFIFSAGLFFFNFLAINRFLASFTAGTNEVVSITRRLELWSVGMELLLFKTVNFFLGYGSASISNILGGWNTTDNFYLDHALGEGALGLIIILSIILAPAIIILKTKGLKAETKAAFLITIIALVVSITGNVLVDPTYGGITFLLLYGYLSVYGTSNLSAKG